MKLAALLGLALLSVPVPAAVAQAQNPTTPITVTRTQYGCDITLPKAAARTLTDQLYLVIDGNSEGLGGGFYFPDAALKPLHYTSSVSNDLDGQVKDILKAQGVLVKDNVTTYRITCGVNVPSSIGDSQSLIFRHESNLISYTQFSSHAIYKVGDKISLFEAVALDSSMVTSGILGESVEKQNQLPHDLLHRITIQVQFVPKTPGKP